MPITFNNFLDKIKIDPSIKNLGQLYQKYRDEAEKVDLSEWFSDWYGAKNDTRESNDATGNIWEQVLVFSLEIEFPNNSGEGKRKSLLFNHVSSAIEAQSRESLRSILINNTFDYENAMELEQSILVGSYASSENRLHGNIQQVTKRERQIPMTAAIVFDRVAFAPDDYTTDSNSKLVEECNSNESNQNIAKILLKIGEKPEKPYEWFYQTDKDSNESYTHFFLFGTPSIFSKNVVGRSNYRRRRDIIEFIKEVSFQVRNQHIKNLLEFVKRETVRSAKAAIMSRNMSHNLGSHVMFYIKQKLESVEQILQTGALKELVNSTTLDEIRNKLQTGGATFGEEMPFLVGLGRFLNYLQERQDFIATVATNYIPYSSTINFKDAIYDELKPEKRAERHGSDSRGKKTKNLLLDYIAYSEGFTSSDKVELLFKKDDNTWFDGTGSPKDVPLLLREFNVALPGGNLGRQAFFSIMENIIRNTAKHDKERANGKLRFRFERLFKIDSIEGYCLRQGEDKESEQKLADTQCYDDCANDFHYLGITVALEGDAQETIDKIKGCLRRDYLTLDGQKMDDECKGLKEMRISAAWIRGKELDGEIPINEPPAVALRKTEEGYLQYVVCLPKPKNVAFISEERYEMPLDEFGCRVFDGKKIEKQKREIADFDLVVCSESDFDGIQPFVGARILKINDVYNNLLKEKSENVEDFIGDCYLRWLKQEFPDDIDVNISICDEKAENNNPETNRIVQDKILHCGSSSTTDIKYYEKNVLFSTHYPGQAAIYSKGKGCGQFPRARFVEAISGGNSTDRLIRHDKRDAAWFCRHISAGLSQVAIFDERLFSLIMPEGNINIRAAVKEFLKTPDATVDDFLYIKFNNNQGLTDAQMDIVEDFLANKELNEDNCVSSLRFLSDYSKTWQYREKGIWGFDIQIKKKEKSEKYDTVEIVGYTVAPTREEIGIYNPEFVKDTIAYIVRVGNKIKVKPADGSSINDFKYKKFDFVSIHQGLLDKIYGALKIKEDNLDKKQVTNALFEAFSIKSKPQGDREGFLPQFVIHSGRSKPNKNDMPQNLPFLQFSAIDHALRDCKHTLTELLYSAHYEQD